MIGKTIKTLLAAAMLLLAVTVAAGCGYTPRVLHVPPQAAYRTIGMVTGSGENESAAVGHAVAQAEQIEAHAIVLVGRKQVGSMTMLTYRVIRYHGDPPD